MTTSAPDAVALPPSHQNRVPLLVTGIAALVAFAVLRLVVGLGALKPLEIDLWWDDLMLATESNVGLAIAWVPAHVGGTIGMIIIGALIVAAFLIKKRRADAAHVAIAMVVVVAIGAPMAAVIARLRPDHSLAESVPTSFPSGHTAVATTVALTLALIFQRWYVWVLGSGWVVLMMWSRTYLHAHWLSDVVAGFLEGVAVAALVWVVIEVVRDRRAAKSLGSDGAANAGGELPIAG